MLRRFRRGTSLQRCKAVALRNWPARGEHVALATRLCRRLHTTPAVDSNIESQVQESTRPIIVDEFKYALDQICPPLRGSPGPQRFALAVSGGVDSMCLAHLARKLELQHPEFYGFAAMVVDHKARSGSTEEAILVQKSLTRIGMPTSILHLHWPENSVPLKQANFETEARKLRYRAMGRMCYRQNYQHLLLAHHEDDQAETVLGRIVQGYLGHGLAAMAPRVRIPECRGMPGIDETPRAAKTPKLGNAAIGVTIVRPLLGFSKERLRLTCQDSGIPWIDDPTNEDRTLTLRNTTRYLLKSGKLPLALRKKPLLNLSKAVENKIERCEKNGMDVISRFDLLQFDLRSGKLVMSFSPKRLFPGFARSLSLDRSEAVETMAAAMMPIVRAVSPLEKIGYDHMLQTATRLLGDDKVASKISFTMAGIQWQREEQQDGSQPIWTLTRQPYNLRNLPPQVMSAKPHCIWSDSNQCLAEAGHEGHDSAPFGAWQFYDGRFWIRVKQGKFESVVVRPFEPSDRERIRETLSDRARQTVSRRLQDAAPEKCRWTLPVLADRKTNRVLALPTLSLKIESDEMSVLDWDVQYKYVDWRYCRSEKPVRKPRLGPRRETIRRMRGGILM